MEMKRIMSVVLSLGLSLAVLMGSTVNVYAGYSLLTTFRLTLTTRMTDAELRLKNAKTDAERDTIEAEIERLQAEINKLPSGSTDNTATTAVPTPSAAYTPKYSGDSPNEELWEPDTYGDTWEDGSDEYWETMDEQAALDAQIDAEERAKITYYEDFPKVPDFGSVTGFKLLKSYERLEGSPQYGGVVYQYEPGTGYFSWEEELLNAGFEVLQVTNSARLLGNGGNIDGFKENDDGTVTITWTTYILYQSFEDYQRIIINHDGRSTLEEFIRQAEAQNNTQQGQGGGTSGNSGGTSGNSGGTSGNSGGSSGGSGFNYDYDTDIEMDYGTDWYNPYADDYQSDSDYDSGTDTWYDDDVWYYNPYGSSDSYDDNHYDADGDNDGWDW